MRKLYAQSQGMEARTHQIIGQASQSILQAPHDLISLSIRSRSTVESESLAQNKKGSTESTVDVQFDPLRKFRTEVLLRDVDGADSARLTGVLQFGKGEG